MADKQKHNWLLTAVAAIVLIFFGLIARDLLQIPGPMSYVLLAVLAFTGLRILYELTFNRGKIPSLNTAYLERRKMADILQKDAAGKPSYTVFDLGSGGGAMTRMIGRRIPQAKIIGYEIAPIAYKQSLLMQKIFGPKNIEYRKENFLPVDCSKADAVVLFLTAAFAKTVGEKLYKELKPGALVVTNEFPLQDDWKPQEVITVYSPFKGTVLVYRR
jgi:SAM-dependent methyltransferase